MQPRKLQCCIWRDLTKPSLRFSWLCAFFVSKGNPFWLLFYRTKHYFDLEYWDRHAWVNSADQEQTPRNKIYTACHSSSNFSHINSKKKCTLWLAPSENSDQFAQPHVDAWDSCLAIERSKEAIIKPRGPAGWCMPSLVSVTRCNFAVTCLGLSN